MIVWTRRCCAPSCRSRTTRRRSSSVAATIRARDAARSDRAWMFEIAVATRSVNSPMRDSVPAGSGSACREPAIIAPQSRPSTTIGQPTAERTPRLAGVGPERAGRRSRSRRCGQAARFAAPARRRSRPPNAQPGADRTASVTLAPAGDDGRRLVALVAEHRRDLDAQQPPDLFGDRREDLRRWQLACDQRRHAPQRGLLVGEPAHLLPRLGVRDRRGDELREGGDPRLGVRRERPVALRGDDHHAPEALVDDDRGAHRRAEAELPAQCGRRAGRILVAVHPRRPPGSATRSPRCSRPRG